MTREKETFFVSRYAVAKVEMEQLVRYMKKSEVQFEQNWTQYESQLEKYLQAKQYKDWVPQKDDMGNITWINLKTLKTQLEHPGKSVFQTNKKILKAKAEDELRDSFRPIVERRMKVVETVFEIKNRVGMEMKRARSEVMIKIV